MPPSQAARIQVLEEDVINKMAAGEIIVRPLQAVKELVENSMDARSSEILVMVWGGGFDKISVHDNGCGIHPDDFEILAQRFTTSKLREFEDLKSIATNGFRGEALASLSYVSQLSVTSKQASGSSRSCLFENGAVAAEQTQREPYLAAEGGSGASGTTVTFENLFYNLPNRRAAFSKDNLEFQMIRQYITSMALRYSNVKLSVRNLSTKPSRNAGGKADPTSDLKSRAAVMEDISIAQRWSPEECMGTVKTVFGAHVGAELIPIADEICVQGHTVTAKGLTSHPNASVRPSEGLITFFLNDRLVSMDALKKRLEQLYAPLVPKGRSFWTLILMEVPRNIVDVNVHPSKRIVTIQYESEIIDWIVGCVKKTLGTQHTSRQFELADGRLANWGFVGNNGLREEAKPTEVPYKVRADSHQKKLSEFLPQRARRVEKSPKKGCGGQEKALALGLGVADIIDKSPEKPTGDNTGASVDKENISAARWRHYVAPYESGTQPLFETSGARPLYPPSVVPLLQKRWAEKFDMASFGARVKQWTFVGAMDADHSFIQEGDSLLVLRTRSLMQSMLYVSLLCRLGSLPAIHFPAGSYPINDVWVDRGIAFLKNNFKIEISLDSGLVSLPRLLGTYFPGSSNIKGLIDSLRAVVDTDDEGAALVGVADALVNFFTSMPDLSDMSERDQHVVWSDIQEFVFFKAIRGALVDESSPYQSVLLEGNLAKKCTLPVACLKDLYKVFERC